MNPSRTIARPIVAQAVIFLLLGREVVTSPSTGLARLAVNGLPATGELTDRRVDRQLGGIADRDPPFQEPER